MHRRMLGGILLIAGTAIGGGMLALPLLTGSCGFIPAFFLILLCWSVSVYTAYLTIEVNFWFKGQNINIPSMAQYTLGLTARRAVSVIQMLFLYTLTAAFMTGGGQVLQNASGSFNWLQSLLLISFFAVLFMGAKIVDFINRILMIGLCVSLLGLLFAIVPQVKPNLLLQQNVKYTLAALSVAVGSFGFHAILPSLVSYLEFDLKAIKKTIMIGSCIPLVVYFIWEAGVLGVIPWEGVNGLQATLLSGNSLVDPLIVYTDYPWIGTCAAFFSFFAIATSFLGVSMGLCDFIGDSFKIPNHSAGKLAKALLTILPPLLFAIVYPNGFVMALAYAGVFVGILEAGLPTLMVWRGRYHLKKTESYKVFGGKLLLIAILIFVVIVITLQIIFPG
ncbi:MAG: tyrosine transporter [Parachlamydiales bacterium]|nr:tyrosine transporter [Parachlamydiales bacterium]